MSGTRRQKETQRAAAYWNRQYAGKRPAAWLWWEKPLVAAYLGNLICGEACSGTAELAARGIETCCAGALPFASALSVGCGSAYKELALLQRGLVSHFTLYDISEAALIAAGKRIEEAGFGGAVTLAQGDALAVERGAFDLVYWDNALHHMLDVRAALAWSRARLKKGGSLAVNDYVGPSRFQWPDDMLHMVNEVILPLGVSPTDRPSERFMIRADPSEAADSGRIREALLASFPNAAWVPLGGAIYHVGLTGKIADIPDPILSRLLRIDAKLNEAGMYVYAWATAVKE